MVNLLTESFETDGNGTRYTTSIPELTDGSGDFYTRTDGTNITGTYTVTGEDGGFYFAMMDTDGDAGGAAIITMTFAAIDITGYENLSFSGLFAEDDATDGFEDWDANVSLQIEYSIDGGAFQDLLSFESTGGTNTGPAQDTDFDGVGDGTALTSAFSLFTAGIVGTGASLVLRVTARNFTAGDEDIAFDNFQVDGDLAMNAAPVAADLEAAALSYQEMGGAQDITGALTLTDADDTDLEGATISITSGLDTANDSLVFVDQNGITGVYTTATGILVLTGTSSVANYQAAIRSITYENAFTTESTTQRTISITVNDGDDDSVAVTRDIDFVIDETFAGTAGPDTIFGGFGTDTINGDASNDRLFGEEGDDFLNGGDGNDQLWGGAGADAMDGGAGLDSVYYLQATAGVMLDVVTGGTGGEATGDTYTNVERFFGSNFDDEMTGGAGDDQFFGLGGMDTLTGNDGDDRLYGHGGDDMLLGGSGADRLYGGDDSDTIEGGADDDFIYGGDGMDFVQGDGGNDRIYGQGGDDMMFGNDGDDLMYGGLGDDTLDGGIGADRLYGEAGMDDLGGGDGDDLLYGGDGDDTITGGADNDTLFGDDGMDTLSGNGGVDRLFGGDGDDIIDGGDGNDSLWGDAGADSFFGGAGIDRVLYTTSTAGVTADLGGLATGVGDALGDTFMSIENLVGSQFDDRLTGDVTNNLLVGLGGNDILSGEGGDDRLIGGDGADILTGGAGNDRLIGQAGADTYVFAVTSFGTDQIIGWEDGIDIINFEPVTGITSFGDLTLTQSGSNTIITTAEGTIIVRLSTAADFTAADFTFSEIFAEEPPTDKNNATEDLDVTSGLNQDLVAEFLSELTVDAPIIYMADNSSLAITVAQEDDYSLYQQEAFEIL